MKSVRLLLEPQLIEAGELTVAGRLEHPGGQTLRLWWRLPAEWAEGVTPWADPWVVGFIFPMMQWRRDVVVEGRVSPSLLANIETYMAIWRTWLPNLYQPVAIRGQEEAEPPPPAQPGRTLAPFSCGVDSSFTVFRHTRCHIGRRSRPVDTGVVMHGFDIWMDQPNADVMYRGLLERARAMLGSLAVACVPVSGNFHELPTRWKHSYATHLIATMRLLAGAFDTLLIPNCTRYQNLGGVIASHPVCNPYLGSASFRVLDDGGECHRVEKVTLLAQWPEAMRGLRVCFENPATDANCCRCDKCLRTILACRIAGVPRPEAFPENPSDACIRRARIHPRLNSETWEEYILRAEQRGLGRTGWARAMRSAVRRKRFRLAMAPLKRPFIPLRNRIRVLFRGSSASRRELACQEARSDQHLPISRS